jgi:hypothetical protein
MYLLNRFLPLVSSSSDEITDSIPHKVTYDDWFESLKTLAFEASEVFQMMIRTIEGQALEGRPSDVIVHNTSVKHTKAGSIPRGLQIA